MNVEQPLRALETSLGSSISDEARALLLRFADLVVLWNARMDLTAAKTPEQMAEVLFADALMLARPDAIPMNARIVDIGSGAGAPALPLLLLRPDLTGTLVEPLRKRVAFMRTVCGTLADLAKRVVVVGEKLDLAQPTVKGAPFDVAMARATFAPETWLKTGALLAPRVLVLTAEAPALPIAPGHEVHYTLPRTKASRIIGVYAPTAGTT